MERRQSGARLIFYRADRGAVISSIWGPVESKSRSARSGPRSRASINILTYTTWNSRLIYCRYLGALVFGPPGADIICFKKCARQRGPPTTVLPILRGSDAAPLTGRPLVSVSRSFFFFPPSLVLAATAAFDGRRAAPRVLVSPTYIAPFYPKIALRSQRDRLTIKQHTRGSGRKQQVAELDLATNEILVFYRRT